MAPPAQAVGKSRATRQRTDTWDAVVLQVLNPMGRAPPGRSGQIRQLALRNGETLSLGIGDTQGSADRLKKVARRIAGARTSLGTAISHAIPA